MSSPAHPGASGSTGSCDAIVIGAGQSGLAAAHALRQAGLAPVVLEAGPEPVGSWPHYYDSLTLFSPARYSSLPGLSFPGDPDRYPHRDEVADYLRRYATHLEVDIRTGTRVDTITATPGGYRVQASRRSRPRWSSLPPVASVTRTGPPCPASTPSPARPCTWPTTAPRSSSPASTS